MIFHIHVLIPPNQPVRTFPCSVTGQPATEPGCSCSCDRGWTVVSLALLCLKWGGTLRGLQLLVGGAYHSGGVVYSREDGGMIFS